MPNLSNLRLPFALLAVAMSVAASADQIVKNFKTTRTNYFNDVKIDAFDPALGTLTSVAIALDLQSVGGITLLNRGAYASNQYVYTGLSASLDIRQYNLGAYSPPVARASYGRSDSNEGDLASGASFTNSFDYSGSQSSAYAFGNDGTRYDNPAGVFTGAALERFYARYAGDQTAVSSSILNYVQTSTLPNSTRTYDFDAVLKATLTYTYTPVPEPASCVALAAGALALLRRRKRA